MTTTRSICAIFPGRTDDLTAIVDTIDAAEEFIYISVADYVPMRIFGERQYWPLIDDRLRMGKRG